MHHTLSADWIVFYIPRCGWDLRMHVCQASSGIVDEVGVSLPGRSVGPLWRFRHAQIHTGNLWVIIRGPGDPAPKPVRIQVTTLCVDQTHRFEYR